MLTPRILFVISGLLFSLSLSFLFIHEDGSIILPAILFVVTCLVSAGLFWIGLRSIRSMPSNEISKRVLYDYYRDLKLRKTKKKS
jgi:hypothetical protein